MILKNEDTGRTMMVEFTRAAWDRLSRQGWRLVGTRPL